MIFVDSNLPLYLVGAPHRNRDRLEEYLRAHAGKNYVMSAEVYQEIVHRYVAIDRRGVTVALTCDTSFALRPGIECVP